MFKRLRDNLVTRRYQVAGSSALAVVASAFPAFAEGPTTPSSMSTPLLKWLHGCGKRSGFFLLGSLASRFFYFLCPCFLLARLFPSLSASFIPFKVRCNV